jgi:hypothetical protein
MTVRGAFDGWALISETRLEGKIRDCDRIVNYTSLPFLAGAANANFGHVKRTPE